MDNWALKAVEREAMGRARMELLSTPIMTFGLSPQQIAWLKHDYERRTGKQAHELDCAIPLDPSPPASVSEP